MCPTDRLCYCAVSVCLQGVSYDHVELNFFLNGKSLQCPITGIRGTVYPVFYGESPRPGRGIGLCSNPLSFFLPPLFLPLKVIITLPLNLSFICSGWWCYFGCSIHGLFLPSSWWLWSHHVWAKPSVTHDMSLAYFIHRAALRFLYFYFHPNLVF